MQRPIWLAFFCLLGIGGLFAARSLAGVAAISRSAPHAVAADVIDVDEAPLAKGDRLPSRLIDNALPKIAVDTIKITPTQGPKQSELPKGQIVSWHWHQGGKIVRHRAQ